MLSRLSLGQSRMGNLPIFLAMFAAQVFPALAQDAALMRLVADLDKPELALLGSYAACLAGQGDVQATAGLFTAKGWTRYDESEMGLITLTPATGEIYVTLASDGSFCDVASETTGTVVALGSVQGLATAAGLPVENLETGSDCAAVSLGPRAFAEINSSGNDPVCQSETTSAVRFFVTKP